MKLYTEEKLRSSMLSMKTYIKMYNESVIDKIVKNHIDSLTPIELPSDEEIHKSSPHQILDSNNSWDIGFHNGWKQGAKWILTKIQGGNK